MRKMNYLANSQFEPIQMRKTFKEQMSFMECAHNVAPFSSMQVCKKITYLEVINGILTKSCIFDSSLVYKFFLSPLQLVQCRV